MGKWNLHRSEMGRALNGGGFYFQVPLRESHCGTTFPRHRARGKRVREGNLAVPAGWQSQTTVQVRAEEFRGPFQQRCLGGSFIYYKKTTTPKSGLKSILEVGGGAGS